MRILFLTTIDPYAESNGGTIYTRALLKLLNKVPGFEVVVVRCQQKAYSKSQKLLKLVGLAIAGLFSSKPMKAFYFLNSDARNRVRLLAHEDFDFVIYDKLETLWARKYFAGKPDLLISQNLEYELQRDRLATHRSRLLRIMLRADTEKLGRFESRALEELGGVIFISAADQREAGSRIGGEAAVIPPVFPPPAGPRLRLEISDRKTGELRPAFIGDLRWWPNKANLQWLIDQVLPRCTETGLPVTLDVYGKGSEEFRSVNVAVHGFIPDIQAAWSSCDFLAAPTLVGGGLNVKIAEAVWNGVPVVTTSKAAQAFEPTVAECFLIAENPDEWRQTFEKLSHPTALDDARARTANCASAFSEDLNIRKLSNLVNGIARSRASTNVLANQQ